MTDHTTHILYEWEDWAEVEIMGKTRRYSNGYRSLIVHRLDTLEHFPQIPTNALKTPVWYSGYTERWYLGNGKELQLPHKMFI